MRTDMKKVLCERPRTHSSDGYHDVRSHEARGDCDDLPSHQGMRRPYQRIDSKNFNDHIGPLRHYLRSCLGRRWDDVFSEICANVPGDTTVGDHLRQHVSWECARDCFVIDGKVYEKSRFGGRLSEPWGLYVDPRDGLIHLNDNHRKWKAERTERVDGLLYRCGDGLLLPLSHAYHRGQSGRYPLKVVGDQRAMLIDGVWYWIISDTVPPAIVVPYVKNGETHYRTVTFPRNDIIRKESVVEGRYYCGKRQLSSRELRRHGLRNVV